MNTPKSVLAVEKDKKLCDDLKNELKYKKNIIIINEDFLNLIKYKNFGENVIVFGNLPYNISTQIIASFVLIKKWPPWYKMLIFMFQKEVANRIIAKEGSKDYGRLSILCNWRLSIKKHFDVSKHCFFPKPKINSTVLSFIPKDYSKYNIKNPKNLEMITRILFSNRRKMINKSFKKIFKNYNSVANDLKLDLSKRAEDLSKETFYKIVLKYEELVN